MITMPLSGCTSADNIDEEITEKQIRIFLEILSKMTELKELFLNLENTGINSDEVNYLGKSMFSLSNLTTLKLNLNSNNL